MAYGLSDILSVLGEDVLSVHGAESPTIDAVVALDARDGRAGLAFCSDESAAAPSRIAQSRAAVVICHARVAEQLLDGGKGKTLVVVGNPRLAYIQVANALFPEAHEVGVDATARIHPTVEMAGDVSVGAHTVVDAECRIGAGAVIDSHVRLHRGTLVGRRVRICSGAVIGTEGYGFERDAAGKLHRFPQRGYVELCDDVEVGANACIDRAALDVTRIGAGTKIDDLAYVAHNVRIGESCLIMASTVVAGSSVIGDRVEISPGAVIRDKVTVGDDVRVGLGAVVVADVESGLTVAGVPAKSMDRRGTKDAKDAQKP